MPCIYDVIHEAKESGVAQAQAVGAFAASKPFEFVLHSPNTRFSYDLAVRFWDVYTVGDIYCIEHFLYFHLHTTYLSAS
jgi:hypothetical protein